MSDTEREDLQVEQPDLAKWGDLLGRVRPEDMVESVAIDGPPSIAAPAGDPDTNWMLRYS